MRIAVGGFQHETNTFAPSKAELEDFTIGGGWPPLCRGEAMFGSIAGVNLPAAGFVEAARERGWTPVPLAWAGATPSSYVTDEAFETIAGHILDGLEHAGSLDAVYLDLHGAMVTESHEDGEGELLRRVRNLLGSDIPILVSLDLHANVTPEMMALATASLWRLKRHHISCHWLATSSRLTTTDGTSAAVALSGTGVIAIVGYR